MTAAGSMINGRYQLGERIAQGTSADVYRGVDLLLERGVAVKLFRGAAAQHGLPAAEAGALARLNHPGVTRLFDGGMHGGTPYLVMELVDGRPLSERLTTGPLDHQEARELGRELAAALAHAHRHGVAHHHINPGNILLTSEGARLTGFGNAPASDEAVDIRDLGLVLLEALTGRRDGDTPTGGSSDAAPAVAESLPHPWPGLLRRMTSPDGTARPSAAEVAFALGGTGPVAMPAPRRSAAAPGSPGSAPHRSRPWGGGRRRDPRPDSTTARLVTGAHAALSTVSRRPVRTSVVAAAAMAVLATQTFGSGLDSERAAVIPVSQASAMVPLTAQPEMAATLDAAWTGGVLERRHLRAQAGANPSAPAEAEAEAADTAAEAAPRSQPDPEPLPPAPSVDPAPPASGADEIGSGTRPGPPAHAVANGHNRSGPGKGGDKSRKGGR